jgi:CHRD domain-containing protein
MSRVKLAIAVALLGAAMTVSAVAVAGGGDNAKAKLSGFQEVPALVTEGSGKFKAKVNKGTPTTIDFVLRYEDLPTPPNRAHIHLEQRSNNGPIVVDLCGDTKPACPPSPGTVRGTITQADIKPQPQQGVTTMAHLITAIRGGITYVNVHTAQYPGGEIRGQIGGNGDDDSDDNGAGGDDTDTDD